MNSYRIVFVVAGHHSSRSRFEFLSVVLFYAHAHRNRSRISTFEMRAQKSREEKKNLFCSCGVSEFPVQSHTAPISGEKHL